MTHLKNKLESMEAVLIEGPKLCGKSTTAMQQAESDLIRKLKTISSLKARQKFDSEIHH